MANTFARKTSRSVGTTAAAVGSYTVGASTSTTVIGLSLANKTNAGISANVYHYDGANVTFLVTGAPIPTGASLVVIGGDQKVVLTTGDSIFVQSSANASIDAVMSVLEITP